jgi:hypothetical protein
VSIPDIRHPVFLAMLEYLYTGNLDITLDIAIELLTAADQYTIAELKHRCGAVLHANINVENVSEIFQAADQHEVESLRVKCMEFILKNYDTVSDTDSFLALRKEHLKEILQAAARKFRS